MKKITYLIFLFSISVGISQNLITNGDFESGSTGWSGNALNVVTENGNSYNAANVLSVGNSYDVNLSYVYPMNTIGTTYKLTFLGFSNTNRTLVVGIGLNEAPWTAVVQTVNLTTTGQIYELTLTTNFASNNSRIIFDMGAATGFVGIDNVMLELTTTTCNNGIQDGDETGIDCGGSCPPCLVLPSSAAPTPPARPAADVVSIFSDAYSNITIDNFDAGWCGGAATTLIAIDGNNTLQKNNGIVCHGIDFQNNRQNLTDFTYVHFDFYITDTDLVGDVFNLKLVNFNGGNAESSSLEVNINGGTTPQLVANQWVSVDVPITALGGVIAGSLARNDVAQIGITTANVTNVWYDNIYIHKNTLSVSDFEAANIKMFPNPASTFFTLEAPQNVEKVIVHNLLGQEVINLTPNNQLSTVDISALETGIYIVKVSIEGRISSSRLVKK